MKNMKRILAMAGVIILAGMYALTLIFALSDSSDAQRWLFASLGATVVIPTLIYIYIWIYRLLNGRRDKDDDTSS
ncbi:MAG: hypothetical protein PUI37_09155 [Oscillospiraceae bacterium]|nr:hypothetical protein [Oscillospiraceae bacterium]